MKVLHVIPSLSPWHGGPSVALPLMACGLARAGVQVDVVATDAHGPGHMDTPLEQPIVEDGYTTRFFRRQTRFYTASWPLYRWLRRHVSDYDVVHIHALFSFSSVAAAFWARRRAVPYIVRPLGVLSRWGMENRRRWLKQASFRLMEQRILDGAALVHYTSEQERDEATYAGVRGPSRVLPLGIDLSSFEQLPSAQSLYDRHPRLTSGPVVLYLSRLDAKKGLDLLLPAWRQAREARPGAVLAIAGGGEAAFVGSLQSEARRLGITNDVVWLGHLNGEDKLAAFALAELFVLPSYSENFGIAGVEAMAAGLPVVVSDQVGFTREVQQAGAGVVVPCDVGALTAALQRVLVDDERRQMGQNGRCLVRERFSIEAMTHDLIEMYRSILEKNEAATWRQEGGP